MPTIEELQAIVHDWASNHTRISAAYLFGSRVKGTHRADSDLDVALKLLSPKGRPGDFNDWAELAKSLRHSLGALLPVSLDLAQYENKELTPTVHKGLSEASVLAYSMGSSNSFKPKPLRGSA